MSDDVHPEPDDEMPCCDYRDHHYINGVPTGCACPDHPRDSMHVFGYEVKR